MSLGFFVFVTNSTAPAKPIRPEAPLTGIDQNHAPQTPGCSLPGGFPDAHPEAAEPNYLTVEQMDRLDAAFRSWLAKAKGKRSVVSRNRVRLVFLLLRYTGAKLGEVLALDDTADFVLSSRKVLLGGRAEDGRPHREVYLPSEPLAALKQVLGDPDYAPLRGTIFHLDQGFMRRIFYERGGECGLPKHLANPNTLRRSRAVELLQNGVPLTVVQRILGHVTANSTAAFLDLPEEEQNRLEQLFLERQTRRAVAAPNTFHGRVSALEVSGTHSRVEVRTRGGHKLVAVISTTSQEAMGLREGVPVIARVKTPWLVRDDAPLEWGRRDANRFRGMVERVLPGNDAAEVVVALSDGARLSATVGFDVLENLRLGPGETVWTAINPYSVILSAG